MTVSLCLTTFNRADQLDKGLQSLSHQTVMPDEIIMVDDGSCDHTKKVVDSWMNKLPIKYFNTGHPEHRISSIPRNISIKKATGDIILCSESETLHPSTNIEKMLKKVTEKNFVIATNVWTMGEVFWNKMTQEQIDKPELLFGHPYAMLVSGNMQNTNAPNSDDSITGSNNCYVGIFFGIYKKHLLRVGGFDESFEGHGGDDWNLFDRLKLYGLKEIQTNDISVIHQWHRKDYPYNIYECAEKNLKKSREDIANGIYKPNQGNDWGKL